MNYDTADIICPPPPPHNDYKYTTFKHNYYLRLPKDPGRGRFSCVRQLEEPLFVVGSNEEGKVGYQQIRREVVNRRARDW